MPGQKPSMIDSLRAKHDPHYKLASKVEGLGKDLPIQVAQLHRTLSKSFAMQRKTLVRVLGLEGRVSELELQQAAEEQAKEGIDEILNDIHEAKGEEVGGTKTKTKPKAKVKPKAKKTRVKGKRIRKPKIDADKFKRGTSQETVEEKLKRQAKNRQETAAAEEHKKSDEFTETTTGTDPKTGEPLSPEERKKRFKAAKFIPKTGFDSKDIKPETEAEIGDDSKKDKIVTFLNGDVKDNLDDVRDDLKQIEGLLKDQNKSADDQYEEMRQGILAARKKKREEDLESKKPGSGVKDKMLAMVTKPAGSFFNKIIKFLTMTFLGSVVNRLLSILKDPAQLLDPIKKFFNAIIGMVNAVMKGLWSVTGAPINFIIGGINDGVKYIIDGINSVSGMLNLPALPAFSIPLVPGPPEVPEIPLSKTAQAQNQEAVGMAGGGVVPGYEGGGGPGFDGGSGASSLGSHSISGMPLYGGGHYGGKAINRQDFTETSTDEHGVTTTKSGVRYLSPEEMKAMIEGMGMPALQLTDGSYLPNIGKMGQEQWDKAVALTRNMMVDGGVEPKKIELLDNFVNSNEYTKPGALESFLNRLVPGSFEHAAGDESDAINAATQKFKPKGFSGGGIVPAPYPVGDNILGLSPSFSGLPGYNKGGKVPGKGKGDTVPAMLTPGEFVMSKGAVDQIGADKLMAMNAAGGGTNVPQLMKFAGGGRVPGINPPSKKGGKVIVLGGGNKSSGASPSGDSGDSGESTPNFSSTDPNNVNVTVIKSLYNIMG